MFKFIKKIILWVVDSSTNSANLSLTLRGFIPFLVLIGIDGEVAGNAADSVINLIIFIGQAITAGIALYGAFRKIYISIKTTLI